MSAKEPTMKERLTEIVFILKGNGEGVVDRLHRVEQKIDDHQKWHLNNRVLVLVAAVCSLIGLAGVLFGILV